MVKTRAGWECERCGAVPDNPLAFHAHHAYGRSDHRLRFEPRNGVALCWSDHRWAEEHPIEFAAWFASHRSEDAYYLAEQRKLGTLKRNLNDYLELEIRLRKEQQNGSEDGGASPRK